MRSRAQQRPIMNLTNRTRTRLIQAWTLKLDHDKLIAQTLHIRWQAETMATTLLHTATGPTAI